MFYFIILIPARDSPLLTALASSKSNRLWNIVPSPMKPTTHQNPWSSGNIPLKKKIMTTATSAMAWIMAMEAERARSFRPFRAWGFALLMYAENRKAKIMWLAARSTIMMGKPPMKKPMVVPRVTATATAGEMNMATKMATWLARV